MLTLNVSKRGVVTLPKELLERIAVQPGEKIELTLLSGGQIELRAARKVNPARPKGSIDDFIGCLAGKTNVRFTIEEINEAIGLGWDGVE